MLKQKIKIITIGIALVSATVGGGLVLADPISDQIRQLREQNAANQQAVNQLSIQADNYEDAIAELQARINSLQAQITQNQNRAADLQGQIEKAEADLAQQRHVLGESIRTMYLEGDISTLEILAASKNISEFVDKQQYRNAVQNKIKSTVDRINELKAQLVSQKNAIDRLLAEQTVLRDQITTDRNEQQRLLAYTESQKATYNQQIKANNSKIADLVAQQRRANDNITGGSLYFLRFPGPVREFNPASYPYEGWPFSMDPAPGCNHGDGPDRWGYCTRQCVSYTAWAVEASGRRAPLYYSNANRWVAGAQRDGIPVYRYPEVGDIAISTAGTWGHSMYVEEVSGNKFRVSEMNQRLDGRLRTDRWISF